MSFQWLTSTVISGTRTPVFPSSCSASSSVFSAGALYKKSSMLTRSLVTSTHSSPRRLSRFAKLKRRGFGNRGKVLLQPNTRFVKALPSIEEAKNMPSSCQEMDNSSLLTLAALEVPEARAEVLKRHIMAVDSVSYEEALKTFKKIDAAARVRMTFHSIPYRVGFVTAVTAALASFPLCFHLETVKWFNLHFVTTEVPEPDDLGTWLEVGSWAWNWMEPPLGQISFVLLCFQYARDQLTNLGIKPYTAGIKALRSRRVVAAFPQYDAKILSDYSSTVEYN